MRVRVPGSSANLGPGFDALALAVDRYYELTDEPLEGFEPVGTDDLVWTALKRTGASFGRLWSRSELPIARGMGSSAAACVGAAYLGFRNDGLDHTAARHAAFTVADEIEGHPDNAAASAYGGLNLAVGGRIHTDVPCLAPGQFYMWIPASVSFTASARAVLPEALDIVDVVTQAASCAAVYAGLLNGSWDLIAGANGDQIHETARLSLLPDSAEVVSRLRAAGHAAWLSGSGPSVGALIESGGEQMRPEPTGDWVALGVDTTGCVEVKALGG
ncbi:MAG: hypothetical protein OXB92_07630 [Acidimicrobiaceae bacterium]|nr:homoserine kinase [Acidimicrobiia bacterium]MCY4493707.1 hypothetical protein [Acidimicrobiaceae bacterium]